MAQDKVIPTGVMPLNAPLGEFNRIAFMVQQALSKMQTATLVRVESCTNAGDLSPVGFVDVMPLVNQIDAQGNPTPHVTIYNIPYFRIQGGSNAIVIDPEQGDIGICVFASRDISKIKSTKQQGNPGSFRQYSFSDGMYLGGMLNGAPTQWMQFNEDGIKIHSPVAVVLDAPIVQVTAQTVSINATTSATVTTPTFTINGATTLNGTISQIGGSTANFSGSMNVTGDVTAQGISLLTHVHSGVQSGSSNTGAPL